MAKSVNWGIKKEKNKGNKTLEIKKLSLDDSMWQIIYCHHTTSRVEIILCPAKSQCSFHLMTSVNVKYFGKSSSCAWASTSLFIKMMQVLGGMLFQKPYTSHSPASNTIGNSLDDSFQMVTDCSWTYKHSHSIYAWDEYIASENWQTPAFVRLKKIFRHLLMRIKL